MRWGLLYCTLLAGLGRAAHAQSLELPGPMPAAGNELYDARFEPGDDVFCEVLHMAAEEGAWTWTVAPEGLIWRSYLAGAKEPRFASFWAHQQDQGWIWDSTLGGRAGLVRYGARDEIWPVGWQLDIEGAAFPRLDLEHERDLVSSDFRIGVPLTYGIGPYQTKLAYYHLSSHLGDELLVRNPGATRINFVRDAIVWGHSLYPTEDLRLYAEAGWAFYTSGGTKPWEFQLGIDYSPAMPNGLQGAPFCAVNAHLREEVNFGGNLVVQAGWQWRGFARGRVIRAGVEYYNGKSDQFEFFDEFEEKIGIGLWYDF